MKNSYLKEKVISEIQKLDNENLIAEIYELLKHESEDPEVYILNPEQMAAVDEAQAQIKKGQYLTDAQAQQNFEEWLKR